MDPPATAAPFYWTEDVAAAFPPAFVAFLKANEIHPDNYAVHDVPRYVRVSPRHAERLTADELAQQLGASASCPSRGLQLLGGCTTRHVRLELSPPPPVWATRRVGPLLAAARYSPATRLLPG